MPATWSCFRRTLIQGVRMAQARGRFFDLPEGTGAALQRIGVVYAAEIRQKSRAVHRLPGQAERTQPGRCQVVHRQIEAARRRRVLLTAPEDVVDLAAR